MQIRHRTRFLGRRCGINVEFRKGRGPSHSLFNLQVEPTPRTQAETIQLRWCTGVCSYCCNRVHCYHFFPTLCSVMSHWYLKSCMVEVSILLAHIWQTTQTRDFSPPLWEPVVKHWLAHRLIKLFRQVKSSSKTKKKKKKEEGKLNETVSNLSRIWGTPQLCTPSCCLDPIIDMKVISYFYQRPRALGGGCFLGDWLGFL